MLRLEEPASPPPSAEGSKRYLGRWRIAVMAIRYLLKVTKKVVAKKVELLRSFSFVSIDIDESGDELVPILEVDPKKLSNMVKEKSLQSLNEEFGGVKEIASLLQTDLKKGINGSDVDIAHRTKAFGANKYQKPPAKSFLSFVLEAFKDTITIILLVCAVLSLSFGIKQHGLKEEWYDGGSIIAAVVLVVVVSAVSNYRQSKQFEEPSHESSDIRVQVVRKGRHYPISIFQLVVGDNVSLKIGDQIPADGLFIEGRAMKVDESRMTGESDHVEIDQTKNHFLLSGTKVTDGYGYMLVTAVGMNTSWGETICSIRRNLNEETPFQARLNKFKSYTRKIRLSVAFLIHLVLLIRYFTGHTKDKNGNREFNDGKTKFNDVMKSVVSFVTVALATDLVEIPEGLPFAINLNLPNIKRIMRDHVMLRISSIIIVYILVLCLMLFRTL